MEFQSFENNRYGSRGGTWRIANTEKPREVEPI